jgi:hypothetical protein
VPSFPARPSAYSLRDAGPRQDCAQLAFDRLARAFRAASLSVSAVSGRLLLGRSARAGFLNRDPPERQGYTRQ